MKIQRALLFVAIAALGVLGVPAYAWIASITADPRLSVMGIRLGMTADDIRQRVDAEGPGEWTSSVVAGDWIFEHRTPDETAQFEIHEGQLVALRVDAPAATDRRSAPRIEVTSGSVLVRQSSAGRVRITLLSRACPTHHEEAERLVANRGAAP